MYDGDEIEVEAPLIRGIDQYGKDRGMFGYRRASELTHRDLDTFRARYLKGLSFGQLARDFALSAPQSAKALAEQLQLPPRTRPEQRSDRLVDKVKAAVDAGAQTTYDVAAATGLRRDVCSSTLSWLASHGQIQLAKQNAVQISARGQFCHVYGPALAVEGAPAAAPKPTGGEETATAKTLGLVLAQIAPGTSGDDLARIVSRDLCVSIEQAIDMLGEAGQWRGQERTSEVIWEPTEQTGSGVYRPRYGEGLYFHDRCHWTFGDKVLFARLIAANVPLKTVCDVLGRSPRRVKDARQRFGYERPRSWRKRRKVRDRDRKRDTRPLLAYPYIAKPTEKTTDISAVNALVASAYPEHMRADICQEVFLAILEGVVTLDSVRKQGIRAFVADWRKKQTDPWGTVSLDAPLPDGRSLFDLLSNDPIHEVI